MQLCVAWWSTAGFGRSRDGVRQRECPWFVQPVQTPMPGIKYCTSWSKRPRVRAHARFLFDQIRARVSWRVEFVKRRDFTAAMRVTASIVQGDQAKESLQPGLQLTGTPELNLLFLLVIVRLVRRFKRSSSGANEDRRSKSTGQRSVQFVRKRSARFL